RNLTGMCIPCSLKSMAPWPTGKLPETPPAINNASGVCCPFCSWSNRCFTPSLQHLIFEALFFTVLLMAQKTSSTPSKLQLPLQKKNYMLMLLGVGILAIGYMLMSGGGSADPNVFSEEIFSFRRITLAPIVVLIG